MPNGNNANYERIDTNYEFFPSVRQGYRPTRPFDGDDPKGRTTMGVDLTVKGKNKDSGDMEEAPNQPHADLRMYGPGDVTGIDRQQVIRVEPEPNTDTFPPNYLPLVEFDRADMAWLFSPERANKRDAGKARPWMCLVAVERDHDDVSVQAKGDKPLPALTAPQKQLPPVEEVWAWAHVQVVGLLSTPELDRVFTNATPQAVCRLLCPRNLDPNTSYIAAVVPTFKPGRKIGLGKQPFPSDTDNPPLEPAWETDGDGTVSLPVYYKWEFTTGDRGDFESMVRKLTPRNLATDYEIGVREVDMSDPGPIPLEAPEGITRKLGGALKSPTIDTEPYPKIATGGDDAGKRKTLREILNDPATAVTDDDSDIPVKGPPIYGQWYVPPSATSPDAAALLPEDVPQPASVPTESSPYFNSWFHDLNVNPQYRIPAGYGTAVIQENQEALMEEAWNRFGDLKEANAKIAKHQAGDFVGSHLKKKFDRLDTGVVGLASRVQSIREINRRIQAAQAVDDLSIIEGVDLGDSPGVDPDVMETAGVDLSDSGLIDPKRTRFVEGIEGSDAIRNAADTGGRASGRGLEVTDIRSDGGGGLALDTAEAARFASVTSPTFRRISRPGGKLHRALDISDPNPSRTLAGTMSDQPGVADLATRFARASDGDQFTVDRPSTTTRGAGMATRSRRFTPEELQVAEGARLRIPDRTVRASFRQFEPQLQFDPELQVQNIRTDLLQGRGEIPGVLDAGAWSKQWAGWKLFPGLTDRENPLDRIMAAPEFDWPMYKDLRDLDEQYLLPGVDEIPRETIGALATNPKFIESFMCGLNHEMGRELLWRRYPNDRRGTYFRQFWDYRKGAEQKDIKEMHRWLRSELGTNDPDGSEGNRVVLIVRGDLLRAYPDTRIYAAKAVKEDKSGSDESSPTWDRVPLLEQKRQEALENREKVDDSDKYTILPHYETSQLRQWEPREYIFRGNIEPDVTFFGFEITAAEAAGNATTEAEGEELGWFFVLEEPVGETRFGLDVPSSEDYGSIPYGVRDGSGSVRRKMDSDAYNGDAEKGWDGLSWGHLVDSESALKAKDHIRVKGDRPAQGSQPWAVVEGTDWTQSDVGGTNKWQTEDESQWGRNSAHMAHITWQQPVRVCIHADDILPAITEGDDGGGTAMPLPTAWSPTLVAEDGDST